MKGCARCGTGTRGSSAAPSAWTTKTTTTGWSSRRRGSTWSRGTASAWSTCARDRRARSSPAWTPGGWDAGYNYGDFSPDGKTLVVNRGGFIFFWKVPGGEPVPPKVKELTPIQTHNTSSQYAPDGKTLVVGAYGNGEGPLQRMDRVIDLTGQNPPRRLRGFDPNNIWARLTLSPNRHLAMLHTDKIVELLDWATDKHALMLETKDSPFAYVTFTPDSKVLVTLHLGLKQASGPGPEGPASRGSHV